MSEQKHQENMNKESNSKSTQTLLISIVIIIAAIGIGMVIRGLRSDSTEKDSIAQIDENQSNMPKETPEVVYTIPPVIEQYPEPLEEIVIEPEPEPKPVPRPEPVQNERRDTLNEQERQDATQWMSWFNTLTQEEKMALFRGSIMSFMQLMQRWQNLPPEQVMEERAFLEELIQGWRDLPAEDRQQGIENIQYQLEQWLQSGQQY